MISTEDLLVLDPSLFERVIALVTDKGGVGKTSIIVNLSGLYAAAGNRVLIVDIDPQANVNEDLGITNGDDGMGLYRAIAMGEPLRPFKDVRPNLDVITAGAHTHDLVHFLNGRRARQTPTELLGALRDVLAPIVEDYDYVFIDTNPGIEILQDLALATARYLLIPAKSDASSRKAMRLIAKRFVVAQSINEELELLGVVLFGSNSSAKTVREEALKNIGNDLGEAGDLVFNTVIRHVEAASTQARNSGRLVHELEVAKDNQKPWYTLIASRQAGAPTEAPIAASVSSLAGDYQSLATEVVERVLHTEEQS